MSGYHRLGVEGIETGVSVVSVWQGHDLHLAQAISSFCNAHILVLPRPCPSHLPGLSPFFIPFTALTTNFNFFLFVFIVFLTRTRIPLRQGPYGSRFSSYS